MSEREQWWKEVTIHNYDEVVDGGRCIASEDESILLKPAQPAAGSWRTDIENAPRNEVVLILHQTGIYSIGVANPYDYIREYPPAYWAPIYPPQEAPDA